jgi:hypothetical protein
VNLVLVEWIDSHSPSKDGWQATGDLKEFCVNLYCRSAGWELERKNGNIVIVPHLSGEKNGNIVVNGRGSLTIPLKAVQRIIILRKEK